MTETFATRKQSLALVLDVEVSDACELQVRGYDAEQDHSTYFSRRLGHKEPISGRHKLVFPLPVSPNRLRVKLTPSTGFVVVHGYTFAPLESDTQGFSKEDTDFIGFAQWISVNLPLLPPTAADRFPYQSKGGKFMVLLRNRILNTDNTENSTPARINRKTAIAEVSKHRMQDYSIPMRMVILLHEYMHYKLDSTDESACDLGALGILISLGYSATEALYTFTKVFDDAPDKPELRRRVALVLDTLVGYQQQNPRYVSQLT